MNKQRPLNPKTYAPKPLAYVNGAPLFSDAAVALKQMAAAMKMDDVPEKLRALKELEQEYAHWNQTLDRDTKRDDWRNINNKLVPEWYGYFQYRKYKICEC